MTDLFRWTNGRQQGCEYRRLVFWLIKFARFGCDSYLIHYRPNTTLQGHTDIVKGKKHYRVNIELYGNGDFICENVIFKLGPIVLFRPDIETHGMVNKNSHRWIFSLGWAINESS